MRKLTKLLSALIVLVLATAFIGCGNPSSSDNDGGNSNSPTYTLTTGRPYIYLDDDSGFIFNDDYSVSRVIHSSTTPMSGYKWRIVNGNTVEIYLESTGVASYTFTANSTFTVLTLISYGSEVYNEVYNIQ